MPSLTPAEIVRFIDECRWNADVPALQDSHGPLYIDRTHREFIQKLLLRLDRLDLDAIELIAADRLEVDESIMFCRSAAEDWARDSRSKTKIAGESGRACDNPVVVIRRILDGTETVAEERSPAPVAEDQSRSVRRPRLTEAEILAEIAGGETESQEFKSSLRRNLETGKKDTQMTEDAVEAIQGFQNRHGGVLYLGVADNGSIIGIEHDGFKNTDRFLLHLEDVMKPRIGETAAARVVSRPHHVSGHTICRVECKPSPKPVFKHRGHSTKEKFCVRFGPSTRILAGSEMHEYISEHFQTETTAPIPIPMPVPGRSATQTRRPTLSREAQTLLLEGATDTAGTIYRARGGLGGNPTTFVVNGKTFGEGADARSEAAWEAAIERLEELGLVRVEGSERAAFKITLAAYEVAETVAPQAKIRVRFEEGTSSSTGGDGRDRLLLKWKGTLELYNTEPQDVFGLSLELKPGQDVDLTELRHTHLRSGEAVEIDVLVSRQFDRHEVVACHNRFAELLPDDLRSLTCRLSYTNSLKIPFYTLYRRDDEPEECKYLRRQPEWPVP